MVKATFDGQSNIRSYYVPFNSLPHIPEDRGDLGGKFSRREGAGIIFYLPLGGTNFVPKNLSNSHHCPSVSEVKVLNDEL